jgi:lysophospholipase L1-like esterase
MLRKVISLNQELIRKPSVILFGDSHVEYFKPEANFGATSILTMGRAGDTTRSAQPRLEAVIAHQPAKVLVLLGVNDLGEGRSTSEILYNYRQLLIRMQKSSPATGLRILSLLPANRLVGYNAKQLQITAAILELNQALVQLAQETNAEFINLYPIFALNQQLNPRLTTDGLHLNSAGYKLFSEALKPYLT